MKFFKTIILILISFCIFNLANAKDFVKVYKQDKISKYFSGIFLFTTYNLAGWSSGKSDIDFRSSSIVWSLNLTGWKSNFGVGVAGADPLYLSKMYPK